jgi:NTE family protein
MRLPRLCALLLATVLAGCSTLKPWQNAPAPAGAAPGLPTHGPSPIDQRSIVAALTLSGGGARAAAFGLGVLRELKDTRFTWEGRETTLLDEVGLVSGVSGGSILAAHYASFGDETLTRFEPEFLLGDFDGDLILDALAPTRLHDLSSPWYGRSDVLAAKLDALYRGRTFADLARRPRAPELLVTATDLTTGAPFEFTPEQFALICSDLGSVPLSFAVASSSAVPLLLSPTTLRNHAGACPRPPLPATGPNVSAEADYRTRMLAASAESYLDVRERPFLHLVDGGLADNLGMRGLLDRLVATGSIQDSFRDAAPGSIRQLVLIAVNSERDLAERIDQSDRVPSTGQVMDALLFGAGSRVTQMTLAMLDDDLRRWKQELQRHRGEPGSPFAADAEIHVVSVSLHDVPDPQRRRLTLQVPTAFTIAPSDVQLLQDAAREALRRSASFQRLRASLGAAPQAAAAAR